MCVCVRDVMVMSRVKASCLNTSVTVTLKRTKQQPGDV